MQIKIRDNHVISTGTSKCLNLRQWAKEVEMNKKNLSLLLSASQSSVAMNENSDRKE